MRYLSEVQGEERDFGLRYVSEVQEQDGLGFPWGAVIPAVASIGTGILGLIAQDRARDAAREQRQIQQRLQLLMDQAQRDIAQLRQTLPERLTPEQAQQIVQAGAKPQRQRALDAWSVRFRGLPNGRQFAEAIAEQVQSAYLDAAQGVQARRSVAAVGGGFMITAGLALAGYAAYRNWNDD